ncbi:MAG: nuclear transport factor 2 family protein [Pseudomonas sp.]
MRLSLREVAERAAIVDCLNRYAQGVDQRDWPLYASAFSDDARIEVPGYLDDALTPEAFRRFLCETFDATRLSGQHLLGNTRFVAGAGGMRTVTEFLAVTLERDPRDGLARRQVAAGLYIDDLVRGTRDWRIRRRVLVRKSDDVHRIAFTGDAARAVTATLADAASFTFFDGNPR